jgi:uncharacterized protein YidB (DUF937 family)
MGLFDTIKESFGGALGPLEAAALPMILARVFPNGLQGMLGQLQQSGLGGQVSSWVGNGPNQPITVDQLRAALSDQHVQQLAQSLGIPTDKVLEFLSAHLPAAIDQQSPQGVLQEPAASPEGGQA